MQSAPLSDPLYYLRNAESVVDWCLSHYADLLTAEELEQLACWIALPEQARALLVRMVMRKGDLFRGDKLSYDEIPLLIPSLQALVAAGLVNDSPKISAEQMASVLVKQEIWQWLFDLDKQAKLNKQLSKAALLAHLADLDDGLAKTPAMWWPEGVQSILRLQVDGLFERLRLLFFGNLHQQWSEFVITELGYQTYEQVPIVAELRAFQKREEIEYYCHLHELGRRLEQQESLISLLVDVPKDHQVLWLQERLQHLLFGIGHYAERQGDIDAALQLYRRSGTNAAKVRELRVMEKHGELEQTYALARQYIEQTRQPATVMLLQRVAARCAKKLNRVYQVNKLIDPVSDTLRLPRNKDGVEQAVVMHYQGQGMQAYHLENDLFTGLFGLLFWQAIFAPVPGAFFNPYQLKPRDLYEEQFQKQRQTLIDAAFASLQSTDYQQRMLACWQAKQGVRNRFVNWTGLTPEVLQQALSCIPAKHLEKVFRQMLLDLKHHCSGMPDLVVFDQHNSTYELVEVKGPGDRLQEHQKLWLDFYQRNNIPAQVVYVEWMS